MWCTCEPKVAYEPREIPCLDRKLENLQILAAARYSQFLQFAQALLPAVLQVYHPECEWVVGGRSASLSAEDPS